MRCVYCGCALFQDEQGRYLHLWSGWHNCDPHEGGSAYAAPDDRQARTVTLTGRVL